MSDSGAREIITSPSEAGWLAMRALDVTSTESSALFDMSPYATRFELWHRKRSRQVVELPDNDRMKWGRRLQDTIAAGIAEDEGWLAEPMRDYIRIPDAKMGASFDWRMIDATERLGVFEIKNVDSLIFLKQWSEEDGALVAPDHIEIQLQHQLHVCGYDWGAIGVFVGGNTPHIIVRERDKEVGQAIESRIREFWASVETNEEPPPAFPGDAEFLCKLHSYAEPGKVFDARQIDDASSIALEYQAAATREKLADEDKKIAKAKLLMMMGEAEQMLLPGGGKVSAGMIGPVDIAYTRKGYRAFRVTVK